MNPKFLAENLRSSSGIKQHANCINIVQDNVTMHRNLFFLYTSAPQNLHREVPVRAFDFLKGVAR